MKILLTPKFTNSLLILEEGDLDNINSWLELIKDYRVFEIYIPQSFITDPRIETLKEYLKHSTFLNGGELEFIIYRTL